MESENQQWAWIKNDFPLNLEIKFNGLSGKDNNLINGLTGILPVSSVSEAPLKETKVSPLNAIHLIFTIKSSQGGTYTISRFSRFANVGERSISSNLQLNNSREECGEDGRLQDSDVARVGRAIAFDCRIERAVLRTGGIDGEASAQFSTQVPLQILRLNSPLLEYGVQNPSCSKA
nr:hypothetical protein Iba_chr01cCG8110 [Ipomoea batatas]